VAIVYEEQKNIVRVTGQFCAEQLKQKLLCKLGKVITDIKVEVTCELTKKLDLCLKEHLEIRKSINVAKKECTEVCKKICIETCEGTCKKFCEGNCNKGCKPKICKPCPDKCKPECKSTCEPECNPVTPPKPPPCKEQQLQVTICCSSPCPCFVPSCNNYRCCSCGVVGFPGWFGTGMGSGPGYCGGRPSYSHCSTNVAIIDEPSCSIM
jgi:hypothetical protein